MACLGILFGCRPDSAKSYVFSALIIVGILVCLRLLCYTIRLLVRRDVEDGQTGPSSSYENTVEMQPENLSRPLSSYMNKTSPESTSLVFQGR
ncbi:hypothetical protein Sango_0127300 [Sesamum angolense]|uniref:Uncharacterized protein n=1 Tax=Sesamum angolense TaxID=2727404 RepID=A0AAE1XF04_9LAMI|nr:hypothetical protein Sango_0127300 [Sesamum angolense]